MINAARRVRCGRCTWQSRRRAWSPDRPCPACGGRVYLVSMPRGRPRLGRIWIKVEVRLRPETVLLLNARGNVATQIRKIVEDALSLT